jgi:hypothetical protein
LELFEQIPRRGRVRNQAGDLEELLAARRL